MTHEYTLLLGATVLPGPGRPSCEAIAWAANTVLAVGTEAEVRAISRGDSRVLSFPGAFVVPLDAPLEVGGPADLAVVRSAPGSDVDAASERPLAEVRAGVIVAS